MDIGLIYCLTAVAIVILFMVASLWLTRPRCPECNSLKITEISKRPISMRGVDMSTGGGGGGYGSTQTMFEVLHRCTECETRWTTTKSETR